MQRLSGTSDRANVLGVTLCNEAYRSKAETAARQFVACTGCPVAIIEERDFADHRTGQSADLAADLPPRCSLLREAFSV